MRKKKEKDSEGYSLSCIADLLKELKKEVENPQDEYLTPAEAAIILKCTKRTVFNYSKRGWLDPKKVGKRVFYTRKSIMDILEGRFSNQSLTPNNQ